MMGATSGLENVAVAAALSTDAPIDRLLDEARIHGASALLTRSGMTARLMKKLAECMLAAELEHHLLAHTGQGTGKFGNYRNGSTPKTVSTPSGELDLAIPRVRFSTFVPRLIPRYQRRLDGFDDSILVLYARGLNMHALQSRLQDLYDPHAWAELHATMTDAVLSHARNWQARRLERSFALIYFDTLQLRHQTESQVAEAPLFFALGARTDGRKDFFGFWIEPVADVDFWCKVMLELKGRGLIGPGVIAGGRLHGLQEAAALVYPAARFRAVR